MMFTQTLEGMNKLKLRSACRSHKVKGYSKMSVAQMRDALAKTVATAPEPEVVVTPTKPKSGPAKKAAPTNEKTIKRPKEGGACAKVWAWLDDNRDATVADVRKMAERKKLNLNNAVCEFYAWRKFCGITSKGTRKLEGAIVLEDGAAISINEND